MAKMNQAKRLGLNRSSSLRSRVGEEVKLGGLGWKTKWSVREGGGVEASALSF